VPNIITPIFNFDKSKNDSSPTQAESISWIYSKWPETLIAQHNDLDFEIKSLNKFINIERCSLIQLDVRLKKLTKALLTHLELEANFLTPILTVSKVSAQQKKYLNQSFDALYTTCRATIEYIHSLKLLPGNALVTAEQRDRITLFLDGIKKRLNDEDIIYSHMAESKGALNEV
jgi:hypothetical protein